MIIPSDAKQQDTESREEIENKGKSITAQK